MPPYKFTEEEKEALRTKYRNTIETLNAYLDAGARIQQVDGTPYHFKLDMDGLNKKLNDPSYAYFYKKGMELKQINDKKKEIQDRLEKKFSNLRDQAHPERYQLPRFVHVELIPSDDPAAEAYNEEKIKMYLQHPEAVTQRMFQKMLNTNVQQLAEIAKGPNGADKDAKMVTWATENFDVAFESFEIYGTLTKFPPDMLTPEMQKYISSVGRNFEPLIDTTEKMIHLDENALIFPPVVTEAQENLLGSSDLDTDHYELSRQVAGRNQGRAGQVDKVKRFSDYFAKAEKDHIDLSKDGALSEYVIENVGGAKEPYVSLGRVYNPDPEQPVDGKPRIKKLTDEELAGLKKVFKVDYTKEAGYKDPEFPEACKGPSAEVARDALCFKYATKFNIPLAELDGKNFSKIAEHIKGGVGERLFRTTSHEYNNLIQTLKDYDNENHVNYKNSTPVKMAANDYLIHKGVKTREEAMNLPYPAKDRALLCFDVIDEFQKAEPAAEDKMIPGTKEVSKGPHKEWPPAIEDANLVNEELPFAEEYDNDIAPVKENVKENVNDKVNEEPVIEINNK